MVAGHSAGVGLAVGLTLRVLDEISIDIALCMPTRSSQLQDCPVWDCLSNALAWKNYLRGVTPVPDYASPASRQEWKNFSPTIL